MYFVYLLECEDGTLYTGVTTNLERRFKEHALGTGARYTRTHGAKQMLYSEPHENRSRAQKREAEIKRLPRAKKLALVTQ